MRYPFSKKSREATEEDIIIMRMIWTLLRLYIPKYMSHSHPNILFKFMYGFNSIGDFFEHVTKNINK